MNHCIETYNPAELWANRAVAVSAGIGSEFAMLAAYTGLLDFVARCALARGR
jgi:hypothetical protein